MWRLYNIMMYTCNNCESLINLMVSHFTEYHFVSGGIIEFEGQPCEIGGVEPSTDGVFILSPKYHNMLFIAGGPFKGHTYDGDYNDPYPVFNLYVTKGPVIRLDEVLGITLPASKREEIIATLLGEW